MNPITITADRDDWIRVAAVLGEYLLRTAFILKHGTEDQKAIRNKLGKHEVDNMYSMINEAVRKHEAHLLI